MIPSEWRTILNVALALVCTVLAVVTINQVVLFNAMLFALHPFFSGAFLFTLLSTVSFVTYRAFAILIYLPQRIRLTPTPDTLLSTRNELVRQLTFSNDPAVRAVMTDETKESKVIEAVTILDAEAKVIISQAAASVFKYTAISQSGVFDGLIVLYHQVQMINRIAVHYYQRPTLTELFELYRRVFISSTIAVQLDDIDYMEQLDPIINEVIGQDVFNRVPGLNGVVHLITNSVIDGSINAYFTIKLGVITKNYCRIYLETDPQHDRLDSQEACRRINERIQTIGVTSRPETNKIYKEVVGANSRSVVRRCVEAIGKKIKGMAVTTKDGVSSLVGGAKNKVGDFMGGAKETVTGALSEAYKKLKGKKSEPELQIESDAPEPNPETSDTE